MNPYVKSAQPRDDYCLLLTFENGEKRVFDARDIPLLERIYAAPKYGIPSQRGRDAIQKLARLEGILLDPVYTGKAFAGLLDLIEKGKLGSTEPIIFLHTGGLPALFAFENFDPGRSTSERTART